MNIFCAIEEGCNKIDSKCRKEALVGRYGVQAAQQERPILRKRDNNHADAFPFWEIITIFILGTATQKNSAATLAGVAALPLFILYPFGFLTLQER